MTWRLTYQDMEKTLTDDEVAIEQAKLVQQLTKKFEIVVRQ